MSAAIQHRMQRERSPGKNSSALWPAYHNSNAKLLRLAQEHVFSSFPNSISTQYTHYGDKISYNARENGPQRSGTPFVPTSLDTDDEDQEHMLKKYQVCPKIEEMPTNGPSSKECTSYPTEGQYYQEVNNPDYINSGNMKDTAALRAFYTTSTQRLYQGVDWSNRILPSPAPPNTTKEAHPDITSFRYESKRYDPHSEKWQKFGSRPFSWDYLQTRDGYHIPGPIRFCSPSKNVVHIPGYMGHVSGGPGEMDNPVSQFVSANKLRSLQPKCWETARKGNIPGYTGCVLYSEHQPACTNDPDHLRSTAAKTYRQHNEVNCNSKSPFKKTSSMSRMVTLTRPFNPFNKVH